MTRYEQVIVIDDDYTNNLISENLILGMQVAERVHSILRLQEAEQYFLEAFGRQSLPDLILLDLNFPEGSGWDFLSFYKKEILLVKDQPDLFILTSSISRKDKDQVQDYQFIKGFINKPLTREKIMKNFLQ
ncbi:MAG: response regulator [Thermonemataceae bacterium]